jgi:acetyltransferase-like isoleucine patch superfamily enzyme
VNFRDRLYWRVVSRLRGGDKAARRLGARIGHACRIYSFNVSAEPFLVSIGDNVTVSSSVTLVTHDGAAWLVRDECGRRYDYRPITIGDNCFIGLGATLLPGTKIGDNCIVGAGAVVRGTVPSGSVVAGVPAVPVGTFDDYAQRRLHLLPSDRDLADIDDYRDRVLRAVELASERLATDD